MWGRCLPAPAAAPAPGLTSATSQPEADFLKKIFLKGRASYHAALNKLGLQHVLQVDSTLSYTQQVLEGPEELCTEDGYGS